MGKTVEALLARPDLYRRLKKICGAMVRNSTETAEDILHDAIVQALLVKEQYVHIDEHRFVSWISLIARRKFLDRLRASRHTCTHASFDAALLIEGNMSDQEQLFLAKEVLHFIEGQSKRRKNIFLLFAVEHRYKEIAQKLGIPIGTVCSSIAKIRKKFRAFSEKQKAPQ